MPDPDEAHALISPVARSTRLCGPAVDPGGPARIDMIGRSTRSQGPSCSTDGGCAVPGDQAGRFAVGTTGNTVLRQEPGNIEIVFAGEAAEQVAHAGGV